MSLESRLNGECSSEEQTQQVCLAWQRINSFCNHSAPATHPHILTWLQKHTAHTLLQSKWQTKEMKHLHSLLSSAIDEFIDGCRDAIAKRDGQCEPWETQLLQRAKWFKSIIPNPWGHPVLKALLDDGETPTDEQILKWLKEERGVVFVTRLRQMATSKCLSDLALKLTTAVMTRVRACTTLVPDVNQIEDIKESPESVSEGSFAYVLRYEAGFTKDVWELLTDIEFMLLHKANQQSTCIDLAKRVPFKNSFHLIERLADRQSSKSDKKLWKNATEVAKLIAQAY
ncbi:unnamed protein product [Leptidea sinapis]|uniref:Uncharacterized protein n=1 Tax=Leptidea sinapis TaxID=189913 RepID=A0A5E4PUH8_9NEOP|nr:unnamed protein product [Leptidea sinapis]